MLKLSNRVRNALGRTLGPRPASDVGYVASLQPETLLEMSGLGHRGIFELAVAMIASRPLDSNIASCARGNLENVIEWPAWLAKVGPELSIPPKYQTDDEAQKDGMVRITTRFNFSEWYSLIRTCADLHRGDIEWDVMTYGERSSRGLAVCRAMHGMEDLDSYMGEDAEETGEADEK